MSRKKDGLDYTKDAIDITKGGIELWQLLASLGFFSFIISVFGYWPFVIVGVIFLVCAGVFIYFALIAFYILYVIYQVGNFILILLVGSLS